MQDEKKVHSIKKVHLNQKDRMCGVRRKSAVSGMSHLEYE